MEELKYFLYMEFGNSPSNIKLNKYTRFDRAGSNSNSCWVYYTGQMAFYGSWSDGDTKVWKSKEHKDMLSKMDKFQVIAYNEKLRRQQYVRDAEAKIFKEKYISDYWNTLKPANESEYFINKKINIQSDFRQDVNSIAIPYYNYKGIISAIQCITVGFKKFITNSQCAGSFYPVRCDVKLKDCTNIFLCEGVATAISTYKLISDYSDSMLFQVWACGSASNIKHVRDALKLYFPEKWLFGIADNDEASFKAMREAALPYLSFDGQVQGYDANDAVCSDYDAALIEFTSKYNKLTMKG